MAAQNFEKIMGMVLTYEGGYSTIRSDPGNWTGGSVGAGILKGTKYGIAASAYPQLDIKNLTVAQAREIYRAKYWNAIRGDNLPSGVDAVVMDFAVNSGPARAAKYLQMVVGVPQDGQIGPATLQAIKARPTSAIINSLCDLRLAFLKRLPKWGTFGKGWSDRVRSVRFAALLMVGQPAIPVPPPPVPTSANSRQPTPTVAKPSLLAALFAFIAAIFARKQP